MTDLKYSEEELRQREMLFRLIFEHAPVGVSWKRADLGRRAPFQRHLPQDLDLSASTVPDYALLTELTHPEDLPRHREVAASDRIRPNRQLHVGETLCPQNSRLVWGRLSVAVVRDEPDELSRRSRFSRTSPPGSEPNRIG